MKNIILDMDNTLIFYHPEQKLENYNLYSCLTIDKKYLGISFHVIIRPYLFQFLNYVYENFDNVFFWSAARIPYLHAVINTMNDVVNKKPKNILTSEHMINGKKKLQYLYNNYPEINSSNTWIVDDSENVIDEEDRQNFIKIPGFIIPYDKDDELLKMITKLNEIKN
jgi:hypothetical protein